MPNSISRTRRLRSPPTCNRSRCARPCRPSSRNWAATARPKRSKARTGVAYTSRPIDIDILFYDDEVIASERLTVPHPLLSEREFALAPLCEIMRQRRQPVTGQTMEEMYKALRPNEN
ncbi:MAG: 2-amino-4-hydroxy-6-hydroxymethyldihydropteridine diphosphokinase [Alistipes onderdonkii]